MTHQIETAADLRAHYAAMQKRNRERDRLALLKSRVAVVPKFEVSNHDVKQAHEEIEHIATHRPLMIDIVRAVSDVTGVAVFSIRSHSRKKTCVLPRHVVVWLSYAVGRNSFGAIGRFFKMDHSTILHAVKKVDDNRAPYIEIIRAASIRLGVSIPLFAYTPETRLSPCVPWSFEDDENLKRHFASGLNPKKIGFLIGRTNGSVGSRLRRLKRMGKIACRS